MKEGCDRESQEGKQDYDDERIHFQSGPSLNLHDDTVDNVFFALGMAVFLLLMYLTRAYFYMLGR